MPRLVVTNHTDPACPWAFSAEPQRRRLQWLYGDALAWRLRMVVLSERPEDHAERGFTPEKLAQGLRELQRRYGMPIDWSERPRVPVSEPACRAVVATRLRAPAHEERLLRRLRVLGMGGALLDDPGTLDRAAREASLDPGELREWSRGRDVAEALAEDKRAARRPTPAAEALDHKLAGPDHERRYTCPSLLFARRDDDAALDLPGFQPPESYEAAIANLAPDLERRDPPEDVREVLAWAGEPLATVEVAAVCELDPAEARRRLARCARFEPVGGDGYWSL